jgi:hypothetical protein
VSCPIKGYVRKARKSAYRGEIRVFRVCQKCLRDVEDIPVKEGIQPTKHAPHDLTPVPRRSQFCNCLLHNAALCAAFSVSGSSFTILEYKTISHETEAAYLDGLQGLESATPDAWR